ncbi:MAG: aminotransferase class V-fold PLP-dependent enzyme [Ruminococcaceae bacterium]|nr:aminotransferase class V-fold PLP-dependent enzyme [Oscillospiraceae bacterium]
MIYFDNGASSFPKPASVSKAMSRAVSEYGANPGRSGHKLCARAALKVYSCRSLLAEMFNAEEQNIVFTLNATMSVNTVIKGIVEKGDEVIVSDLEHNSVIRPLKAIGARISVAEVCLDDDKKTVENFKNTISPYTKMIFCTHASNVLGKILPIREIGLAAKSRNIPFGVDASQSAGVVDIDVMRDNIDFLCLAGHKGLYGPQGIGVIVLNCPIMLKTLVEGGTGVNSAELFQPENAPERYESGTLPTPCIAGLEEGVRFIKQRGLDNIFKQENELLAFAYKELSKIKSVILYTPFPDNTYTGVLSFNIKGKTADEVAEILNSQNIFVRSGLHCAPFAHKKIGTLNEGGTVRISFGAFNSYTEIKTFLAIIQKHCV